MKITSFLDTRPQEHNTNLCVLPRELVVCFWRPGDVPWRSYWSMQKVPTSSWRSGKVVWLVTLCRPLLPRQQAWWCQQVTRRTWGEVNEMTRCGRFWLQNTLSRITMALPYIRPKDRNSVGGSQPNLSISNGRSTEAIECIKLWLNYGPCIYSAWNLALSIPPTPISTLSLPPYLPTSLAHT